MDESEPVPIQVPRDTTRPQSFKTTGVETAVAYRVTSGLDPVPVLVIPDSAQIGSQSDWGTGAQVFDDVRSIS